MLQLMLVRKICLGKNRIQKRLLPRLFILPIGNGWQFAEKNHPEWGKLAVCVNQEEWQDYCVEPPCGQVSQFHGKILFCYSIWYRFFYLACSLWEISWLYFFQYFWNYQKTRFWWVLRKMNFFPNRFFRILAQSLIKYLNSISIIKYVYAPVLYIWKTNK